MVMVSPTRRPKSIIDVARWRHTIGSIAHRARLALGSRLGARYIDALGSRAHFNDRQLASTTRDQVELYRTGAVEVVDVLARALADAGLRWRDIRACLDASCGYGRIVRELRFKISAQSIAVCDYDDEAARFTASEFGVRRLPSVELIGPERNGTFDLIYALTPYTELDRPMIEMNLAKLAALTRVGGVVMFGTQGMPSRVDEGSADGWVDTDAIARALDADGFFHQPPAFLKSRGVTYVTPDEVMRMVAQIEPDLALIAHHPVALDRGRDLFVYRKF